MSDEKQNVGHGNVGSWNVGNWNVGHRNAGHRNVGDENVGNENVGSWNAGHRNVGNENVGHRNAGDENIGDENVGNENVGNWNVGHRNAGDLNTNTPTVRLFNHDSGWTFFGHRHTKLRKILRKYQKGLCVWVYGKDMSEKEKEDNPTYKTTGGYLKVNKTTYNQKPVTKEDREFLESVPNFCPKILKECTGIVFDQKKTIIIDGKKIEISQESYKELKKSLLEREE